MAAAPHDAVTPVRPATSRARTDRSRRHLAICAAVLPMLGQAAASHADPLYWDINGTVANTGTTASGTWSATTTNWNSDSTGAAAGTVTSWVPGSTAVFSSGTNFTGTTNVTILGTQTASGVTFATGTVNLTSTSTGNGVLDFGANAATITTTHTGTQSILVPITGSGDLTVSNTSGGDVTFNFDGPMSGFTGNLTVGAGTDATKLTKLQMDSAPGDPTKTITLNSFSELSNANQVTLPSGTLTSLNYTISNPIVLAGSNAWLASANGTSPTTVAGVVTPGQQKIVTYAGAITGTGNLWLGINNGGGRGTVVLGGQSSYAGDTYVVMANNNGLVQLGVDNALPTTTNLVFGSPTAGQNPAVAPLDLNGHSQTVASLASTTTGAVAGIFNTSSTPVTLTVNGAKNTSFKGVVGNTGLALNPFNDNAPYLNNTTAYGNISLVKNGTGSLTLSAAGNVLPSVTINGGTLAFTSTNNVNGALFGPNNSSTAVTASGAGSTLATGPGNVTLNGNITLANGGALAPGGVGTVGNMVLSGGSLSFNDGSRLAIDYLNSGTFDTFTSNTGVDLDSGAHTFDLNLVAGGSLTPNTYHVGTTNGIDWDGTHGFTPGNVPANAAYNYALVVNGPFLDLVITPNSPVYRWSVGGTVPAFEGGGDWSQGSGNFIDLSTNAPATWNNGTAADVIIGGDTNSGIGDVITLGSNVTVSGKLTFSPVIPGFPYTVGAAGSTNTLTLAPAANTPGLQADTVATINAPLVLATSQSWGGSASSALTVNGTLTGPSNTLTKNGGGIVILNGPGGSLGALSVTGGAVLVGVSDAIGTAPVSLDTNGEFGVNASVSVANPVTVASGGGQLVAAGGTTGTLTGNITAAGTVTKQGAGVLTLTGTNTVPAWTLAGGAGSFLAVASQANLGAGAVTLNNGGLRVTAPVTLANNFAWAATGGNGLNDLLDTAGNAVTLTGSMSGAGDWHKRGGGTLTLAGSSTAKGGAFYVDEASTIVLTNVNSLGLATVALDSNTTFDVETANVNAAYLRGNTATGVIAHKTGTGNLTLAAPGSGVPGANNLAGTTMSIDAGSITLDSSQGLGGNLNVDQMNVVVNAGGELIANYVGGSDRIGGNLTLNGGTVTLPATAPFSTNLETNILQAYTQTTATGVITSVNHGNALNVTANSTIRNLAQATDTTSHLLLFAGPVNVSAGATLTTDNENAGGFDNNTLIAFRGSPDLAAAADATHANAAFPNDAITLAPGATLVTTGPGQTRFGRAGSQGKILVGQGTPGAESVIKFGSNAFLNDSGGANGITRFVVSGSGSAGLRIEASMNSTYRAAGDTDPTHHEGSTGLFGQATNGSHYTVLSNQRLNALSNPYGSPALPVGGTLTVAANNTSDVTGSPLTAGPSAASPLTLAFDNTTSSANANLTYTLDGSGTAGNTITNFAKLQVQRTNAGPGSVKLALAGNTRVNDVSLLNSTTFDLVDHALAIEASGSAATYLSSGQLFSSSVNNDPNHISTIVQLSGSDDFLLGAGDSTTYLGLTIDAFTLLLKPAYYGDINLDGRIDADDYALMDRSVAKHLTAKWFNGDFNHDNAVDSQDYFLLDRSYGLTHGNALAPALLAERESEFGHAYVSSLIASVPEPTSLAACLLAALPLVTRRRRTR